MIMELEPRLVMEIAFGLAGAIVGWLVRLCFDRIRALEQSQKDHIAELTELRINIATNYVSKTDFKSMGDAIFSALRRIEDKLDKKVDKE
jgi:hypothetical protein